MTERYDYVIIGAGMFGSYAAEFLARNGRKVALIDFDKIPMQRASYINQARVHNGYHYPRSIFTAAKSAKYYERFSSDFAFAVNKEFKKIYAIASYDSLTNAEQFKTFCDYVKIPAEEINVKTYLKDEVIEAAFLTKEYSYDAARIRNFFLEKFAQYKHLTTYFGTSIEHVLNNGTEYVITLNNGSRISSAKVLNATYAGINQVLELFGYELFPLKYEMCEVILTKVNEKYSDVGITIMDGPFMSLMPFGLTGYHSLTSVGHTPHETSRDSLPGFSCQDLNATCSSELLQNCNNCHAKPFTAWGMMSQLAKKYVQSDVDISYQKSLFTVKTIMSSSEVDDSRPTIIKEASATPSFISVLSGKFNTIYDLEEVLL